MSQITQVEVIRVALPFETGGPRQGMRSSLPAWLEMECVMLRVRTEDGLDGWGEAFGHVMAPGTEAVLAEVSKWRQFGHLLTESYEQLKREN